MNPIMSDSNQLGQIVSNNITGAWDCTCGNKGLTGNFCSNCGAKRPEQTPLTWDCTCGRKGITGNFCDNCGKKRGE
jgi:membrane protease subunit (stomatin/prohibitin family)